MPQSPSLQVSVIILAYNEAATIGRCLDSLLVQTEPPTEIIVVNNNSTDATAAIASSYPGVRVVDEPQQGFIPARDCGFTAATFPIMARVDADSTLPPGWLAAIRQVLREHPQALGATGPVYYNDLPLVRRLSFPFPGNQTWMRLVGCWPTLVGPNMIITKAAWELVRGQVHRDDKKVHEDMDLSIHIRRHGQIIYDRRLTMTTSGRRLVHDPGSLFFEYAWRNLRTLYLNSRWGS